MTHWILSPVRRLLVKAQRRYRSARPGSVLILVVTLLVLMALIGTAYIATARSDRYSSAQHVRNTQVDLLVDGVVRMVEQQVTGGMFDQSVPSAQYRPPADHLPNSNATANQPNGYGHWDGVSFPAPVDIRTNNKVIANAIPEEAWIAGRHPRTRDVGGFSSLGNPPVWDSVSYPPIFNGQAANGTAQPWQFDSPDDPTKSLPLSLPFQPTPYDPSAAGAKTPAFLHFTAKPWMEPTYVMVPANLPNPNPTNIQQVAYPALKPWFWDTSKTAQLSTYPPILAADTDGDGVADAGLWKLPVGRIDGVTYYAGIRIVDNNSAVNANTAWTNYDFDGNTGGSLGAGQYPKYFFPASVGLNELLRSYSANVPTRYDALAGPAPSEMTAFDTQSRLNNQTLSNPNTPFDEKGNLPKPTPYVYDTLSEFFFTRMSSRLDNPSWVTQVGVPFKTFSSDITVAMAYHGGNAINPDAMPPTLLEEFIVQDWPSGNSFFGNANWNITPAAPTLPTRKTTYAPTYFGTTPTLDNQWYAFNYDWADLETASPFLPAAWLQKRSFLVSRNPVSNQAPFHPLQTTDWPPLSLAPTLTPNPGAPWALAAGIPPYRNDIIVGGNPPPAVTPPRTSINQAPFAELWRAFWNVMVEEVHLPNAPVYYGSPFDLWMHWQSTNEGAGPGGHFRRVAGNENIDLTTTNSPYIGGTFDDYSNPSGSVSYSNNVAPYNTRRFDPLKPANVASYWDYHPSRMFRSSIRAVPDPNVNAVDSAGLPCYQGFDETAPRFNSQQMILLRSALAAVNACDLRDTDNDVTAKRIVLHPTFGKLSGGAASAVYQNADVIVYGTERQPYITEVFAETENEYVPAPPAVPAGTKRNTFGYVCIELYNPYDQDIPLNGWKIVAIDRRSDPNATVAPPPYRSNTIAHDFTATGGPILPVAPEYNLPLDASTLIAELDPAYDTDGTYDVILPSKTWPVTVPVNAPLIVPAKGYLLLENYNGGIGTGGTANYRPAFTGLPQTGALIANDGTDDSNVGNARPLGMGRINVACIPGLSGMIDPNWGQTEWEAPVGNPAAVRSVFNRELVFLRPRRAMPNPTGSIYSAGYYPSFKANGITYPQLPYDETPNPTGPTGGYTHLRDMVPVDSFDFTGLQLPYDGTTPQPAQLEKQGTDTEDWKSASQAWHYVRKNSDGASPNPHLVWGFVYPGRYDAAVPPFSVPVRGFTDVPRPRQQGTEHTIWAQGAVNPDWTYTIPSPPPPPPATPPPVPNLVMPTFGYDGAVPSSPDNTQATYPTVFNCPLAYNNATPTPVKIPPITPTINDVSNCVGPNPMVQSLVPLKFPYGGFARNGDMLTVPFIGSYRVTYNTPVTGGNSPFPAAPITGASYTVGELNAVTADAVFAEDTDQNDDPGIDASTGLAEDTGLVQREELGRFCPVRVTSHGSLPNVADYDWTQLYPGNFNYRQPATPTAAVAANRVVVNDFAYDPTYAVTGPRGTNWSGFWRYRWASRLFDYLCVWSPADDYQPNVPMQREWVEGDYYDQGDLVSIYDPSINPKTGLPYGHQVIKITTFGVGTNTIRPAGGYNEIISCPPVQNGQAPAAIRDVSNPAAAHTEDDVPIEGLVNINTASWRVLATLPLVVNPVTGLPDGGNSNVNDAGGKAMTYRQLNQELAKAIVYWRDVDSNLDPANASGNYTHLLHPHGPFRSIYELNEVVDLRKVPGNNPVPPLPPGPVPAGGTITYPGGAVPGSITLPGFRNGYWTMPLPQASSISATIPEANDQLGDLAPADTATNILTDNVRGDFKERNLQLTRISNLITTRSDSFTCYLLIQGWVNAESTDPNYVPRPVVQRRVAFTIDRSRVTPDPASISKIIKQMFPNN